MDADFLIVGGGVAGLSAGAALAAHGRVLLLEAEAAPGYHSSGRSVSFSHYGIGNELVRRLTARSRAFYEGPDGGALARSAPSLYFAEVSAVPALEALGEAMAPFTDAIRTLDPAEIARRCPILRTGEGAAMTALLDPTGLKLDADALLQFYIRAIRAAGGTIGTGERVTRIEPGAGWRVTTEGGDTFSAPILIDAAGAWADRIAALAGVRPLGLAPRRRTIIAIDPPEGTAIAGWPFVHSVAGDFYMLPEAGRLLVSPADEIDDEPGDAQPDEYQVALAAERLEHYTTLSVRRIAHRWAGLRTFAADRGLVAGFAAEAPGFFWLAGQGGYGLQTAPAMAEAVEALVTGAAWPVALAEAGIAPGDLDPARLR